MKRILGFMAALIVGFAFISVPGCDTAKKTTEVDKKVSTPTGTKTETDTHTEKATGDKKDTGPVTPAPTKTP